MRMFLTEMFSNSGRRILVLGSALMQMPPRVTNVTCITNVTCKFINCCLLVENRRLDVARFQRLFDLVADKVGWTVASANILSVDSEKERTLERTH